MAMAFWSEKSDIPPDLVHMTVTEHRSSIYLI